MVEIQRVLSEALQAGSFRDREAAGLAVTNEAVRGYLVEELQKILSTSSCATSVEASLADAHLVGAHLRS